MTFVLIHVKRLILSGQVTNANGIEVFEATVLAQSETEVFASSAVFYEP
jgi:hypothetical protein